MMGDRENRNHAESAQSGSLQRQVGVFGAVALGLGSIVGAGVFVSIGIAAQATGPAVVLAIVVAAIVATCNGLSSAQLAANHPVSGGTYEYGYRWLTPRIGFSAGWLFLCAKSASAATAALGFAGYALHLAGAGGPAEAIVISLAALIVLTVWVLSGLRRSTIANTVIVSVTLVALLTFVLSGAGIALRQGARSWTPFFAPADGGSPTLGFLEACALMFVAYTGYGRIATLGEEIHEPRRNIPRAMIATLACSMVLYGLVAVVGVGAVGVDQFTQSRPGGAAPLEMAAAAFKVPGVQIVVAVGAATAMLGVLLNLILGLSRVALAMGRRGDLPAAFAKIDQEGMTPYVSVLSVSLLIAGLILLGDVRVTWSFSAFTVLLYYALTNLAALRLSRDERLYPRWVSILGLAACAFLAFWVEPRIWLTGLAVLAAGLFWRMLWTSRKRKA